MTPRKPTRATQLGVDDAEYQRLLEAQGGHCALCPNEPKTRRLHVDHDHKTGRVRGLLCYRCNRTIPSWVTPEWCHLVIAYITEPGAVVQSNDSALPWNVTFHA